MTDLLGTQTDPNRISSESPDSDGVGFQKITSKMTIRAFIPTRHVRTRGRLYRTVIGSSPVAPAPNRLIGPAETADLLGGGRR